MSTNYPWRKFVIVLVVAAFVAVVPCARADVLTWTGATNTDWFNVTNWSPNAAAGGPFPTDQITFNFGITVAASTTTVTTDLGGSITLNNLDFFSTATFDNLIIGSSGSGTVRVGGASFSANNISLNGTGSSFQALDTIDFFVGGLIATDNASLLLDLEFSDIPDLILDTASFTSGASMTVSRGNAVMSSLTLQGSGTSYQGSGGSVETATLTLSNGASVNVSGSHSLTVTGKTTINPGADAVTLTTANPTSFSTGVLELAGGQLNTPNGLVVSNLTGFGTVSGAIAGGQLADISATGSLALGDANSFLGFNYNGSLDADIHTVTLNAAGFTNLGILTTLSGGTIQATNGVALGVGDNISGSGQVNAKLAATPGSTIEATGDLTLGDATKVDGFFSDGQLLTQAHTVTINDANVIVLGSLTQLGDGVNGGGLTAGTALMSDTDPHFLVEEGKNLVGRGDIEGNIKNNGSAISDGTALSERLVFAAGWTVTGKGNFVNPAFFGTFSPGESPGITPTENLLSGGPVEIELGGTTPGFGSGHHDQINDTGKIDLLNTSSLSIVPFESFLPVVGDEFQVITWQVGLDGAFGDIVVDPFFVNNGIDFELVITNTSGAGDLTLRATMFVPEPSTALIVILMAIGLPIMRRRLPESVNIKKL
jgi:hypothetical protein